MYNNAIFVSKLGDIPKVKHWAIYLQKSYSSPGYDPHDSPYSTDYTEYRAYLKKEDWEAAIKELIVPPAYGSHQSFRVAEINPVEVKFDLKLDV
jgi:hypothetical protein